MTLPATSSHHQEVVSLTLAHAGTTGELVRGGAG